jgi:hypothetical protein
MNNKLPLLAVASITAALWCAALPMSVSADSTTVITRTTTSPAADSDTIRVVINDQPVDFDGPGPIMIDGSHVFVPIRGVFEQMGGDVQWHPADQVIEGAKPGHMFRIKVGSTDAVVDGNQTTLPAAPELIGGTTYVPLRFASEALGASVHWHADTNTVSIRTGDEDSSSAPGDTDHMGSPDGTTTTTIIKKTTTP